MILLDPIALLGHAIGANAVVDEELAEFLAATLLTRYPTQLRKRYGIEGDGLDGAAALEAIARKRGCLRKGKGGELDREQAARILLTEYRNGTLGRTSLETPKTPEALASSPPISQSDYP